MRFQLRHITFRKSNFVLFILNISVLRSEGRYLNSSLEFRSTFLRELWRDCAFGQASTCHARCNTWVRPEAVPGTKPITQIQEAHTCYINLPLDFMTQNPRYCRVFNFEAQSLAGCSTICSCKRQVKYIFSCFWQCHMNINFTMLL